MIQVSKGVERQSEVTNMLHDTSEDLLYACHSCNPGASRPDGTPSLFRADLSMNSALHAPPHTHTHCRVACFTTNIQVDTHSLLYESQRASKDSTYFILHPSLNTLGKYQRTVCTSYKNKYSDKHCISRHHGEL